MIGLYNFCKDKKKIKGLKDFIEKETGVVLIDNNSSFLQINGIVLSGSKRLITKREYKDEWLDLILNTELPIIGICFGFQLICRAFGAVFEQREMLKESIPVKKLREHLLFSGIPTVAELPESHKEYVTAVTEPLIPIMASHYGIEAVVHSEKPIFGTQFHFERSAKYGRRILKNFLKLIKTSA